MNDKKPFDALFDADDQTVSRIAAQCEPDWDENRLFAQSYRKYQAQKRGKTVRLPQRIYRDPMRGLVTAACLMIAVGGAGSIWFFRYGVEKPQMTVHVENTPTEPAPTTTEITSGTTFPTTATPHTTVPAETMPAAWETAAVLHTGATAPTTAATQTTVTPVTTAAATSASAVPQTTAPATTAVTAVPTTVITVPATQPETMRQQAAYTTTAQTISTTETKPASTAPATTAVPGTDAETMPGSSPANPVDSSGDSADPVTDNGTFTVKEQNGWINIQSKSNPGADIRNITISIALDGYTITEQESKDYYSRTYTVTDPDGNTWNIRHFAHNGFDFSYRTDLNEVQHLNLNGHPAYLLRETSNNSQNASAHEAFYTLFWDDGNGICMMQEVDLNAEHMLRIAEAVTSENRKQREDLS